MAQRNTVAAGEDDEFARLSHQWSQITTGLRALLRETKKGVVYLLTSRTVQRSLIWSILLLTAAVILYLVAAVVYVASYYVYLPKQVHEQEVYLHYGYGQNPVALTSLKLLPDQPYDISVSLTLPLTPENTKRGNFMVLIHLLDTDLTEHTPAGGAGMYNPVVLMDKTTGQTDLVTSLSLGPLMKSSTVLLTSARPAIIPYTDPLVSLAKRILFLPYHVLFTQRADATMLEVKMVEGVAFGSGRGDSWLRKGQGQGEKMPRSMVVEVQAGQGLGVYECRVKIVARLRGLRWVMYEWRILSFFGITALFWAVEMGCLALGILLLGGIRGSDQQKQIEDWEPRLEPTLEQSLIKEEDEMSDTERTFPTGTGEPPLRYESSSGLERKIKKEEGEEELDLLMTKLPDFGEQGDDEEDGEGSDWKDSGIGTSTNYSDAAKGEAVPRRRRVSKS
ncbi:Putative protein of unknown function [Podospora comata]|uniref:Seipin n=1 Tax=Podospora comata TaxID=48703 RepID=A0ABY6SA32_PODCO|nr:Putative protein of unknown function [Podospora comata]